MTDATVVGEETVAEVESEDIEPLQPDSDDQGAQLSPTKSTRNRPNALDLARAFD
jgi:hypothetical protein